MKLPVGREGIAQLFKNCIQQDRLANCYILNGEAGIGKKTIMEYILTLMYCVGHSSCGSCPQCLSLREGAHPDVLFVNRDVEKASIGVDKIRQITGEVYVKPVMGEYKAVVINEAHLLTTEAQNAMLKLIEEPPQRVVFFLLCDSVATVLPTVYSRSVEVKVLPLGDSELKQIAPDGTPDYIISLSRGNPKTMQRLLDDKEYTKTRAMVIDALLEVASGGEFTAYKCAKTLADNKANQGEIAETIIYFLRDVMYTKLGIWQDIINKDKIDEINAFAAKVSKVGCANMLNKVQSIWQDKGKYGNYNMAITMILLKCREEINDRSNRN